MSNNTEKLQACFCNALGISQEQVNDSLAYNAIQEWDSVGHMTLMSELETEFDLMLDTEDILKISSLAQAKECLIKYGVAF